LWRFRSWCWNFKPKTGVVLSLLLDLRDCRPAVHCGCARYLKTPEEPKRDPKKVVAHQAGRQCCAVPPPSAESTATVPPFSMRGVPAIAANSREGSRLLRFWV
jgi:hypothetical protein